MNTEPVSQPQAPAIDSRSPAASWTAALPDDFGALLRDGIDLHVHGQPDVSRRFANRGADIDVARLAHAYGLRGWVLKSHLWPTMDRAGMIRDALTDIDFEVYGSITLNPPAGGVSVTVVELAASHDAKVVFLPTWGSAADVARGGYIPGRLTLVAPSFPRYAPAHATRLTDGNGSLTGAVREVLDACRALDLSVATGHAALSESLAVAGYCAGIGARVLITHPLHYVEKPGQLTGFTDLGAFVEFCNAPLLHPDGHLTVRDVYAGLEAIGPRQAVLTTDIFSRWVPPEPECFRMFTEQLSYLGIAAADIRQMLAVNPRRFLGLPALYSERKRLTPGAHRHRFDPPDPGALAPRQRLLIPFPQPGGLCQAGRIVPSFRYRTCHDNASLSRWGVCLPDPVADARLR